MLLSISEIIAESWRFYIKNWRALSAYVVLLFLPWLIMPLLGVLWLAINKLIPGSILASNILIVVIFIASLLFTFWTTVALTCALKALLENHPNYSWRAMFDQSYPLLWPFAFTTFLAGLIVAGGTILFIIPGLIFSIWYAFAGYSVLFNNQTGLAALRASKNLVVGRWWSIVVRIVVPNLVFVILFMILQSALVLPLVGFFPPLPALVITNIFSALGKAILTPLTGAAILIVYLDAKRTPVSAANPLIPSQK